MLIKVFFKAGSNMEMQSMALRRKKKKQGKGSKILIALLYIYLLAYMVFMAIWFGRMLFPGVIIAGMDSLTFDFLFSIFSVLVILYGFFFTFSTLAFANDQERLACMPFKRGEILVSRFVFIVAQQSLLPLLIGSPLFFTYAYYKGLGWTFYVKTVFSLVLLNIVPVAVLVILSIFLMRLTPLAKNKDRFMIIAQVVLVVLIMAISFGSSYSSELISETGAMDLGFLKNNALGRLKYVFPNIVPLKDFLLQDGAVAFFGLLKVLLLSAVFVFAAYLIANSLYSPEVSSGTKKKSHRQSKRASRKAVVPKGKFAALFSKEAKLVLRNPTILTNNVISVFIFPLLMIVPILLNEEVREGGLQALLAMRPAATEFFQGLDSEGSLLLISIAGMAAAIIAYAFVGVNSLNTSAMSREGEQISYSMIIPCSYTKQYAAKSLLAILISMPIYLLLFIVAIVFFRIPFKLWIIPMLIYFLASINANLIPLLLDVWHPVLDWENEIYAIKSNKTIVFSMMANWLLATVFGFLIYFMLGKEWFSPAVGLAISCGGNLLLTGLLLTLIPKVLKKTMSHIEDFL